MIDLTPLDVRKKRGDFRKLMRGYDPSEVDTFLELAAERLEELVKENLTLREKVDRLQEQVTSLSERERAVNEALVTAQELRGEIKAQAQREADLLRKEAESAGRRMLADADHEVEQRRSALSELERRRVRFLGTFRQLLERELDALAVEEGRTRLDEAAVDLELRGGRDRDPRRPPRSDVSPSERGSSPPVATQPEGGSSERDASRAEGGSREGSAPAAERVSPGEGASEASGAEPLPPPDADVHALAEGEGATSEERLDGWLKLEDEGR